MLTLTMIKCYTYTATYAKGREIFAKGGVQGVELQKARKNGVRLTADVKGSGKKWYRTMVELGQDDDIEDYTCSCPAYSSFYGMCKHCVALALHYRDTQIGARTPGKKPGPQKRQTSDALKQILSQYGIRENGQLLGEYYHSVRIEPVFTMEYGRLYAEFRVGVKKLYILKNICKLLDDVQKGKFAEYGKNLGFFHDRAAFTEEGLEWLDILTDIMNTQFGRIDFASQIYSSNFRKIGLGNYGTERVLSRYVGKEIEINEIVYQVKDQDPPVKIRIAPEGEEGARIAMEGLPELLPGISHSYFVQKQEIYQCSGGFEQEMLPVLSALGGIGRSARYRQPNTPLFLSKEDYTAFCGNLLPVLERYAAVETKDLDFEEYMPQEVQLQVYLDMGEEEQQGRVRARAQAVYGSTSYGLFEEYHLEKQYRDVKTEEALKACLLRYFSFEKGQSTGFCRDEEALFMLIQEGMGEIRKMAEVFLDEKIRKIRLLPSPKVNIGLGFKGDLLDLEIATEGLDYAEMEKILGAYKRRKKYFRLKSGDFISLEDSSLALVSELSQGLNLDKKGLRSGSVTVPKYRAAYLAEAVKDAPETIQVKRSREFKRLVREMNGYQDSDFEVPQELQASLRSYQKDGFRWLATLAQWGFGGILADDMGLGKTLQMIALLEMKKESALIVCPASLVYNWESELHRFAPDLRVTAVTGNGEQRQARIREGSGGVLITSYDLLKRDTQEYRDRSFAFLVADEAQYIKNAGTQAAKAVKELSAGCRFALTGTPIENKLSDLWSIFDFIMPGYLYDYGKFREEIEVPVVQGEDAVALKRLQRMTAPFILRRKKQDVLKDLPDKLEKTIYIQLAEEQRKLYDARVQRIRMELAGQTEEQYRADSIKYLAELTGLRQICCAPALCYENYKGGSAKTDACLELVEDMIQSEHSILLFSQFTGMLDMLAGAMERRGISYLYLSGRNTKEQRRQMVEAFQNGEAPVFLISLKAGGTGLNLTRADVVIHYDPWWNMAAQNQATDRTHRIGQKNVVTVVKLVARDTIEERIVELQERKARMADQVMEGQAVADHRISREELLELMQGQKG